MFTCSDIPTEMTTLYNILMPKEIVKSTND